MHQPPPCGQQTTRAPLLLSPRLHIPPSGKYITREHCRPVESHGSSNPPLGPSPGTYLERMLFWIIISGCLYILTGLARTNFLSP